MRMFRNGLAHAKKILVARPIPLSFPPEVCASGCTVIFDVRRSSHKEFPRLLLSPAEQSSLPYRQLMTRGSQPLQLNKHTRPSLLSDGHVMQDGYNLRLASTSFQMPNPAVIACNLINMVRCIDLNDLKEAPPPAFWVTVAITSAQLGIPFLELIGGYSPIMTYLQLYIAAACLAWNGGEHWGLAISSNAKPPVSWEVMGDSLVPTGFAILGLLLPYPLGFLTIASGLVASLYFNLKACAYPPWSLAAKFLVALSSAIGLLLALVAYVLFHNREKAKKKKSSKELTAAEDEDGGDGEGEENKSSK